MKIEIIEEKENPLLNRRELKIRVLHDNATPSRREVKEKLVALLGVDKEKVILNSYKSRYGVRESYGTARVYESKERALEVESKPVLLKNQLLEEKTSKEK
jgi:small subunit ribosomal protein S24e